MKIIKLHAEYYRQFDADSGLDVPAEGGGWQETELTIDLEHTALVVMHAWHCRSRSEFPGWYRAVEYLPRADTILRDVFPPLLAAARSAGMTVLHVVGGGDYFRNLPGYKRAVKLAGREPELSRVKADSSLGELLRFRENNVFVGRHNRPDVDRAFAALDFPEQARPLDNEGVAENAQQLTALCLEAGINHLIYAGFAVNWCLLMSPGGMVDMSRRGAVCSVLRQAVTAVENKESARSEGHKEEALWRISVAFGFVFDVSEFIKQLAVFRK